jgi:hypothetical protein
MARWACTAAWAWGWGCGQSALCCAAGAGGTLRLWLLQKHFSHQVLPLGLLAPQPLPPPCC